MTKQSSKFGSTIPELTEIITKYGSGIGKDPQYVIFGQIFSASGPVSGILAVAQNEIYAGIICREVNKNGKAEVFKTEYHEYRGENNNPQFSIEIFKREMKKKMEAQKLADEQAELSEKVATSKFKLTLVK